MNIAPDYLIERKRSKSQLIKWKMISLLLIIIIALFVGKHSQGSDNFWGEKAPIIGDYIARLSLEEIIYDNLPRVKKIEALAQDKNIKALIIHINSPGGSVVGSEMLYNAFRKVAKDKPVVVVMDSVAASGGYLVSLGADYIIAHNGTITGSIGVLMQTAEVTELAEKIGIKFNNFKSTPLKGNPSLTEKLLPEAEQAMLDNISDVYDYFTRLVSVRRNLDIEFVKKIADGRIYSSKQALAYKLIDEIGTEDSAVKWLEEVKGIPEGLKVSEVKLNNKERFVDILLDDLNSTFRGLFSGKIGGVKVIW